MKRLSLLLVACSFTLSAFAHEISAEQSLLRAVEKIGGKSNAKQARGKTDFALVHTEKSAQNGKALYYVFSNEKNGGFVITGGDHRANPVLGHTENGTFEQALDIPAFRYWLSNCEAAMQWISDKEDSTVEASLPKFNIPDQVVTNADKTISMTIPGRSYVKDAALPTRVEPLLGNINWNQNEPYNRLTPEIELDEDGVKKTVKCATGCVATATAQIMKYWEWPKQGAGSNKYTSQGAVPVELEADFSQSVYDWDNMLDDYSDGYTDEQANAVAKLMSDVGIAENMMYGPSSGTFHQWTTYAMATYFGYNKGIQYCDRTYYTYAEWNNLLKTELAASRPINFAGGNYYEGSGHQFVLDGYDEDGNYHVNWGWGGRSNGYFDINYLDPDSQGIGGSNGGYPGVQQININCFPDVEGTSVAHYNIIAGFEPTLLDDGTLLWNIANNGLAPYQGQAGFVAMIDDEIVGSAIMDIEELPFMKDSVLSIPFEALGLTTDMFGDKICYIYPVFKDGDEFEVPLSGVAFQNYISVSLDDEGYIEIETTPEENASPKCESMEITRDYAGFNIKAKALISNEENRPTFDRIIEIFVYNENDEVKAVGQNFAFIDGGESREMQFSGKLYNDQVLEVGETYNVALTWVVGAYRKIIPGSETTVTLKDPGAEASLSYSDFAIDKTVIEPNEELTVSFNVENTGGFGVEQYYTFVFKDGVKLSRMNFPISETDLRTGKTTVTNTAKINLDEGLYYVEVNTQTPNDEWNEIFPEKLYFTIKNPATAISNVTDSANAANLYYDLQGRRVAIPTKGLYIQNGKKVAKYY